MVGQRTGLRRFSVLTGATAVGIVVAAVVFVSPGLAAPTGGPCSLVSPAASASVHVSGKCQVLALGSAGWGSLSSDHALVVSVQAIPANVRAVVLPRFRSEVLKNGAPIHVARGIGSEYLETYSCPNPPSGDCIHGTIMELVGNSVVTIQLYDTAQGGQKGDNLHPAVDEANDTAQEDKDKAAFAAIGKTVSGKV
jgi:hypothetical protein